MRRLEVADSQLPVASPTHSQPGILPRPSHAPDSQLRKMLAILRRPWRVVAAFAAAGLILMAVASFLAERRWTATAGAAHQNQPPVTNLPVVSRPT